MRNRFIASAVLLAAGALFAQEATPTPANHDMEAHDHGVEHTQPLRATNKVAIPTETDRPLYRPARCDHNGNIYFRAYQLDDRKIPITRVDEKGVTVKYTFDADTDFAKGAAYDFSLLPNGNLYQPVQVGQDVYIIAYDQNAKIRWKTKLENQFWISHLTAISDESFLVSGVEIQPRDSAVRLPPKLFTGIFDNHGKLTRRLSFEKDAADARLTNAEKKNTSDDAAVKEPIVLPVLEGDAQTDGNGNIYWMLRSEPPIVHVLDTSGKITKSFEVEPPGRHMQPISMSLAKGRLAIFFRGSFRGMPTNMAGMAGMSAMKGVVVVIDTSNGHQIGLYRVGAELSEAFACYSRDDFTFITPDKGNLAIQHATAQ